MPYMYIVECSDGSYYTGPFDSAQGPTGIWKDVSRSIMAALRYNFPLTRKITQGPRWFLEKGLKLLKTEVPDILRNEDR